MALLFATSACHSQPPPSERLAERLAQLTEVHPPRSRADALAVDRATDREPAPVPDASGVVVAVDGWRLAVRLDHGVAFPSLPVAMAVYDAHGYKGELFVTEVWEGHVLGTCLTVRTPALPGDRARCKPR
jgi:hypothetical protein